MNEWTALIVGVLAIVSALAGMFAVMVRALDQRVAITVTTVVHNEIAPLRQQITQLSTRIDHLDTRIDHLDTRIDHLSEVVDLRLRPLESDMTLIKHHLLGASAA
jgi:uncharacterized protein YlxW (UPF0749 family)